MKLSAYLVMTACLGVITQVLAMEEIFYEKFDDYNAGDSLINQPKWTGPVAPSYSPDIRVGSGDGIIGSGPNCSPSSCFDLVSDGSIDPGHGSLAGLLSIDPSTGTNLPPPGPLDIYILSFEAYANSAPKPAHNDLLGFLFTDKYVSWQSHGFPSSPSGPFNHAAFTWAFVPDHITGNFNDIEWYGDNNAGEGYGYDHRVEFEIVLNAITRKFYGRYNFGSGWRITTKFDITDPQIISQFSGIHLIHDYRRTGTQDGAEFDEIKLVKRGPVFMISELVDQVLALNINQGIQNSLDQKLDAAVKVLDDLNINNDGAAIGSLGAFINATEAQRGNQIAEADACDMIFTADALIVALGGISSGSTCLAE